MLRIQTQIGLIQQRINNRQPGLPVNFSLLFLTGILKVFSQSQQALGGNGCGRAINGFIVIERIRSFVQIVSEFMKQRSTCIPIGNAILG
jgi:hypothetical protein